MLMEPLDLAAVSIIYVCPSLVLYTACLHRYVYGCCHYSYISFYALHITIFGGIITILSLFPTFLVHKSSPCHVL